MLPRSKCAVFAFVHSLLYNPPFMGDKKIFLEPSVSHVIVITRFVLDIKLNPQSGALPGEDGRIERKNSPQNYEYYNTFVKSTSDLHQMFCRLINRKKNPLDMTCPTYLLVGL